MTVSFTRRFPGHAVAVCILPALVCACGGESAPTTRSSQASSADAARVPPLPDVSALDPSVQAKLRSEHAALAANPDGAAAAETYGRIGTMLFSVEYAQAAEPFLTRARMLNARDMRWPYYLGHVQLALQQPEKAAAFFEESLTLHPRYVPTSIWLGEAYLMLGRPADAERHLAAAIESDPASAAAWFRHGRAFIALRDYPRAVAALERALAISPDSNPIHYQLGLAYRGAGHTAKAAAHLRRQGDAASVVPVDPLMDSLRESLDTGGAHLRRGLDAMERRDWPAAVDSLRKATAASPNDAAAHLNLGTALFLSGDRASARTAFDAAARIAPDLPKARYMLGLLAEAEARDPEAMDHFTAAVRLDPGYVEAHGSLADALRRTGRTEASLTHYLKVLSLNPAASQARFGYAMALVRLGRYRQARDWLQQAFAMHPEQAGFPHALARILAAAPDDTVRDGAEARRLTDTLLRSSDSWTLHETRAMVAAELQQYSDAVRWQQEAIARAEIAGQVAARPFMKENLERYRRGLPCRTPWRADDPIFAPRPSN